jgi:stage V sporulation protein B
MLALPAAAGLFMLAKPIMIMLYPTSPEGYIYLQMYSICLIFMIIGQTLAGILQGISKQSVPIIALSIAVVCKLALNGVLIASPLKGMGAALSSIVYYGVFMSINYIMLKRNIRFRLDLVLILVKPLLGTLGMILVVYLSFPRLVDLLSYLVSKGLGNALATLITVFLGIICYFIILMLTKTFTKEELSVIRGKKNGK